MTKLTENELKLIKFITSESTFNFDTIDFSKSFEEQRWECDDIFETFVEIKDYNKLLGTTNEGSRAVLGSLVKKNLCSTVKDNTNGTIVFWLHINEEQFNNIKEALKEMEA